MSLVHLKYPKYKSEVDAPKVTNQKKCDDNRGYEIVWPISMNRDQLIQGKSDIVDSKNDYQLKGMPDHYQRMAAVDKQWLIREGIIYRGYRGTCIYR